MDKLKANGMEYSAQICGKQIDRDWDGRASKTIVLAMPYAQAAQLFADGLCWSVVRYEDGADGPAQEQDCSGYCSIYRTSWWDSISRKRKARWAYADERRTAEAAVLAPILLQFNHT